ncbi:MAG: sulfatase-like hydrolase/transferase, partial [Planctomycetales bacterium]|nr:sulfatase-like hydrolase/transferase [Planctomycetales bacterium]
MNQIHNAASLAFLLLVGVFSMSAFTAARESDRQPNVILILTDDQGSVDVNCYGATDLSTPHMDRLARHGVRFTQFYSAAPVCSPSRAGCLTGRVPQRAGVPGNVGQQNGLPPDQVTIAELLKQKGYATAHIGKWHLGHKPTMIPNAQGFDYSFGHMGGCIDNYSHFF